jgi:antitoxin (DNA-binding transcriptional repressor) of toxin-antitoxin stability system
MTAIQVRDIERDVLGCLRRVEAGESLLVLKDGRPLAEIKPVAPAAAQPRPAGLCAGEFTVPEDFDRPLPADVLDAFEGA